MTRPQRIKLAVAVSGTVVAGLTSGPSHGTVLPFATSAVALALIASLVGEATDQLGHRLSPSATGVLQSAIGNLPELFVSLFALKAGLVVVVQSAIAGSILVNSLLVLGLAFLVGGLRHGTQRFDSRQPRMIATLNLLAVSALAIPSMTAALHTPAAGHEVALSLACAGLLLITFVASIPVALAESAAAKVDAHAHLIWPTWMAVGVLAIAGVSAALVSDWFVEALMPAMETLGLSEAFAGLVIVAIAGNAIENVVGISLAWRNKVDYAVSTILNSSLQVALAVTPLLVILSFFVAPEPMTLVMPPLLVVALFQAALLGAVIVFDGESNWLEGVVLVGLYVMTATAFWWG